jgi:PAS domain S-box-containing protein
MTVKSDSGTKKELLAKLKAQQKTIEVLMNAVEQQFAEDTSPFELLTQNLNLEGVVQRKTAILQQQGEELQKALNDLKLTQTELLLAKSKAFQDSLLETIPIPVFYKDTAGRYLGSNKSFEKFFGYTRDQLIGKKVFDILPPELARTFHAKDTELFEKKGIQVFESELLDAHGNMHEVIFHKGSLIGSDGSIIGLIGVILDITERKQAEIEREKLQSQLNQAQKMESVGRLAGGVAHDFNNMLGVIIGYSELALGQIGADDPLRKALEEILNAGKRSSDITRQLLAFARKQTIAPKVLDLNETVESMLKILRRLIGEDITLAWLPCAGRWLVKLDPSQMDQVLANLCVNARDAISGVGKITIETSVATFDKNYCANHAGFTPGDFVVLYVSDTGSGMDKETLGNVFEPFFTTKGEGRGTGLGLSTVYGIIKQNDGMINVYSELGEGTTFTIYLPRHIGEADADIQEIAPVIPYGHGEVVLVVEDEVSILKLSRDMLDMLGYTVLTADTPSEAIRLAETYADELHVLITDVVMPEMNGRELADQLHRLYPQLKTLFMSGYTAEVIAHRGVLDAGVHFIQKPFSMNDLATKVHKTLMSK